MKHMKGSILVFAVAAAFAGTALAEETIPNCQKLIGYNAFVDSWDGTTGTGEFAWKAVADAGTADLNTSAFLNNKVVSCVIPKNKKDKFPLGQMKADQCSMHASLSSASTKLDGAKLTESWTYLETMRQKVESLHIYSKLTDAGYDAINPAVGEALACVQRLIDQQTQ